MKSWCNLRWRDIHSINHRKMIFSYRCDEIVLYHHSIAFYYGRTRCSILLFFKPFKALDHSLLIFSSKLPFEDFIIQTFPNFKAFTPHHLLKFALMYRIHRSQTLINLKFEETISFHLIDLNYDLPIDFNFKIKTIPKVSTLM